MKKIIIFLIIVLLAVSIWVGFFYWQNLEEEDIADLVDDSETQKEDIKGENKTDMPLELPADFSISILAKDLPGARVIVKDGQGNFWVSQPSEGKVALLEVEDGQVVRQNAIFRNLDRPHGLAFDPQDPFSLYIAETDKISRVRLYSEAPLEKIIDLPGGDGHFTRTIAFGPDDRLYVSIGSSCDTCEEKDVRRAAIYSMNKDGSDFRQYASGLRNAVFFTWSYVDGRMWTTEMGRDFLGDDLPPDEINIIEQGKDYGWPYCYGQQVHDDKFDPSNSKTCQETQPSFIDIPAHSSPLGLAFVPEEGWPEEMWYDLLVAYHGSWNRTEPTGYKIVRMKLDEFGNYSGTEDFISGWLAEDNQVLGRPVDIKVEPGGIMYITDDKAGLIYKVLTLPR